MNRAEAPKLLTYPVADLRPHPSYLKHHLHVPAFKIAALERMGDAVFRDPISITTDGIIIDGYARWELAKLRKIVTILCLEYQLTENEALCCLLEKQHPTDGFNDFVRIELALDLEPSLRQQARLNQQIGGRFKGSSILTEAKRVEVRDKIAEMLRVSKGNVTKVKRILSQACKEVLEAARCREISINIAERWSHEAAAQQLLNLRQWRIEHGIRKKVREVINAHTRKEHTSNSPSEQTNFLDLLKRTSVNTQKRPYKNT